jgi:hypothetical protein
MHSEAAASLLLGAEVLPPLVLSLRERGRFSGCFSQHALAVCPIFLQNVQRRSSLRSLRSLTAAGTATFGIASMSE